MDIWDMFRGEEERRLEQERAAIAAEMAAWRALPQAEQDRISAEREAKVVAALERPAPLAEVTARAYQDVPPAVWPVAASV